MPKRLKYSVVQIIYVKIAHDLYNYFFNYCGIISNLSKLSKYFNDVFLFRKSQVVY